MDLALTILVLVLVVAWLDRNAPANRSADVQDLFSDSTDSDTYF